MNEDLLASVFPDHGLRQNYPARSRYRSSVGAAGPGSGTACTKRWTSTASLLLRRLESGGIRVVARDLTEPSPLALEALNARPYACTDDAPLEERRTQAVMARRWLDPQSAADIGKLDPGAIARVRAEAWPDAATPDELHDALLWLTFLTEEELRRNPAWLHLMDQLASAGRVMRIDDGPTRLWAAAERVGLFRPALASDESLVEIARAARRLRSGHGIEDWRIAGVAGVQNQHCVGRVGGRGFRHAGAIQRGR